MVNEVEKNEDDSNEEFESAFKELADNADNGETELPDGYIRDDEPSEDEIQLEHGEQDSNEDEPWAGISDSQREAIAALQAQADSGKQWEQKYKSDEGRVSALQRQMHEMTTKAEEAKVLAENSNDGAASAKWKEIEEDYEEIAGGINERLQAQDARHKAEIESLRNDMRNTLTPFQHREKERVEADNNLAFKEAGHEDWIDVVNSAEFKPWLDVQSPSVQSMFASEDLRDSIQMLDMYKTAKGISKASDEGEQSNGAKELQAKRDKQLRDSAGITGRKTSVRTIPKDDFEGSFEYYAQQNEKNRASR